MLPVLAGPSTRMFGTLTESGDEFAVEASSKTVTGVSGGNV